MAGSHLLFRPARHRNHQRKQGILQPLLRARSALQLLGERLHLSRNRPVPRFLKQKWFRYGFLIFFLTMFLNMLFTTYLVAAGASSLREVVTLLWTFRLPWHFAASSAASVIPWVAQFAFGFYSVMLTSTVLGLITMALFNPRSWCVYCPMGTKTQGICQLRHRGEAK